jgi:hypothetical protein
MSPQSKFLTERPRNVERVCDWGSEHGDDAKLPLLFSTTGVRTSCTLMCNICSTSLE